MSNVDPSVEIIKKLHSGKKWEEIVSYCQNILDSNSGDLIALQNMGNALLNLGRYKEAISICDKVLQFNDYDE